MVLIDEGEGEKRYHKDVQTEAGNYEDIKEDRKGRYDSTTRLLSSKQTTIGGDPVEDPVEAPAIAHHIKLLSNEWPVVGWRLETGIQSLPPTALVEMADNGRTWVF